jgi:hypothetical protein
VGAAAYWSAQSGSPAAQAASAVSPAGERVQEVGISGRP